MRFACLLCLLALAATARGEIVITTPAAYSQPACTFSAKGTGAAEAVVLFDDNLTRVGVVGPIQYFADGSWAVEIRCCYVPLSPGPLWLVAANPNTAEIDWIPLYTQPAGCRDGCPPLPSPVHTLEPPTVDP